MVFSISWRRDPDPCRWLCRWPALALHVAWSAWIYEKNWMRSRRPSWQSSLKGHWVEPWAKWNFWPRAPGFGWLFLVSRTLVARDSCHFWTSQSRQVRSGLLRYGRGGVGWGWWHSLNLNTWWMLRKSVCLVIAHMVDATQVCLSCHCTHGGCYAQSVWTCHCTHGGCYATLFVLNLHVGWGGAGMMTFFELEHMVDATQLCLSWTCGWGGVGMMTFFELETHGGCYATLFVLNLHVGWGGAGMMTFFELEHMVDATQLCLSWTCGWGGVGMMTFLWTHPTCKFKTNRVA